MSNIVSYVNTFFTLIFGSSSWVIYNPYSVVEFLQNCASQATSLEKFLILVFQRPYYIPSYIIWGWFTWLSVNLLIFWPFKWIRSVIRKCRLS